MATKIFEDSQRQRQAQYQNYEYEQMAKEEETEDGNEKTQGKHQQEGIEGFFG